MNISHLKISYVKSIPCCLVLSEILSIHVSVIILWIQIYIIYNVHRSDEGLTQETLAFKLFTVANLRYQPIWSFLNYLFILSPRRSTTVSLETYPLTLSPYIFFRQLTLLDSWRSQKSLRNCKDPMPFFGLLMVIKQFHLVHWETPSQKLLINFSKHFDPCTYNRNKR